MHAIGKHWEEIDKGRAEPPQGLFLTLYNSHATISRIPVIPETTTILYSYNSTGSLFFLFRCKDLYDKLQEI